LRSLQRHKINNLLEIQLIRKLSPIYTCNISFFIYE
jgi:hypothetical protein